MSEDVNEKRELEMWNQDIEVMLEITAHVGLLKVGREKVMRKAN